MDFTIAGSVLAALLIAIPAIATYFQRANRATRRENRRLRVLVQEFDLHTFRLEREGFSARGVRPPTRPGPLRALAVDDEPDEGGDDADSPTVREPRPDAGD